MKKMRRLIDLVSVGPATVEDLSLLGIYSVDDLIDCEAEELHERLCFLTGKKHCVCVLDVFESAIAQAKDPDLPREKCQWNYYSKLRKQARL